MNINVSWLFWMLKFQLGVKGDHVTNSISFHCKNKGRKSDIILTFGSSLSNVLTDYLVVKRSDRLFSFQLLISHFFYFTSIYCNILHWFPINSLNQVQHLLIIRILLAFPFYSHTSIVINSPKCKSFYLSCILNYCIIIELVSILFLSFISVGYRKHNINHFKYPIIAYPNHVSLCFQFI